MGSGGLIRGRYDAAGHAVLTAALAALSTAWTHGIHHPDHPEGSIDGEDEATVRWYSGGRNEPVTTRAYIASVGDEWGSKRARIRTFAIRDAATGVFVGTIDAHLDLPPLSERQVNLAVAVSALRRRGA